MPGSVCKYLTQMREFVFKYACQKNVLSFIIENEVELWYIKEVGVDRAWLNVYVVVGRVVLGDREARKT